VDWHSSNFDAPAGGGGGSGGGEGFSNIKPCLISTVVYGFRMSKEILTLALSFVSILIVFHK
jgi:hypothetical protein